jgi:hypothetical protein
MSFLECALFIASGSGERPFPMTKEFALDQILGNCSAIHLDKHLIFAQTLRVNSMGH